MKKLLVTAVLLLPAMAVQAAIVASMPNQTGGRIDLYDIPMPAGMDGCKDALIAKAWSVGIADQVGCWRPNDDLVVIKWENGEYRSYPQTGFTIKNTGKTKGKGAM